MTRYLVATASVHVTAAACDYLEPRLDEADDVLVATVAESDDRDGFDALNVAQVRLAGLASVETVHRTGDPAAELLSLLADRAVDELLVGAHAGTPGSAGVGATTRELLAEVDVPVVVVPLPDLD